MESDEKFDVFPTPMSKQIIKHRKENAENGHKILKKKSDALQMKFRKIGHEIVEIKNILGKIMKDAAYLLAETKYHTGDIKNDILNQVCKARLKVRSRTENIAGVQLKMYEVYEAGGDQYCLAGLAKGGEKLNQLKRAYAEATELLVQLATLQTAFITLDDVIKSINRRVNALEHRYIPKCEKTLQYIKTELDENERYDFYRMKMIKNMKRKEEEKKKEDDRMRKEKEGYAEKKDNGGDMEKKDEEIDMEKKEKEGNMEEKLKERDTEMKEKGRDREKNEKERDVEKIENEGDMEKNDKDNMEKKEKEGNMEKNEKDRDLEKIENEGDTEKNDKDDIKKKEREGNMEKNEKEGNMEKNENKEVQDNRSGEENGNKMA